MLSYFVETSQPSGVFSFALKLAHSYGLTVFGLVEQLKLIIPDFSSFV